MPVLPIVKVGNHRINLLTFNYAETQDDGGVLVETGAGEVIVIPPSDEATAFIRYLDGVGDDITVENEDNKDTKPPVERDGPADRSFEIG